MSQEHKEHFQQSFQAAIGASLRGAHASSALRSRLLESLAAQKAAPPGLEEIELQLFDSALSNAVQASQQSSPDQAVAARVEAALTQESGRDFRSEATIWASLAANAQLASPQSRESFIDALSQTITRSCQSRVAPADCRLRVEAAVSALARQKVVAPIASGKVISLPERSRWKRGLAAVASMAAGFALLMGTLLGGAETALADSVRKDHERCCSGMKGAAMKRCASLKDSQLGTLPPLPEIEGWTMVASKVCRSEEGSPMVHNVYLKGDKTLSVHLMPPNAERSASQASKPREIADGDFPVIAWEASGWTVTACSTDLDMNTLAATVGAR